MSQAKKISKVKTFFFPAFGELKKEYSDKVINDWLKKNKVKVEMGDIIWDVQENLIMVSVLYSVPLS